MRVLNPFDSSLDASLITVAVDRLQVRLPTPARKVFDTFGAVIMRLPEPPTADQLLSLQKTLGIVWFHRRSEPSGIAPIEATGDETGYLGTMAVGHPPHTDGAYSDVRPAVVLLSCEAAEAGGGESVLVSGARIYESLRRRDSGLLTRLHEPDAMTICRNGMSSTRAPFERVGNRVRIRYRRDSHSDTTAGRGAEDALRAMDEIVAEPRNQLTVLLRRGEVLMIDNFAVLHGRNAFDRFSGQRRLLRLNLMGEDSASLSFGFDAPEAGR